MNKPVGWIVLVRADASSTLTIAGIMDRSVAEDEESAVAIAKTDAEEDYSSWKFVACGIMQNDYMTKQNLAVALVKLGLYGYDTDGTYDRLVDYIGKCSAVVYH